MTPLTPANHLAARMGRWSATHRKTAILGWLAFVLTALVLGSLVGTEKLDPSMSTIGESGRADAVLASVFSQTGGYDSAATFVDGLVPATYVGAAVVAAGALAALAVPRRGPRPQTTGAALAASASPTHRKEILA